MTLLVTIIGTALSFLLGAFAPDHYYQGCCNGAAAVGCVWLGVHLMNRVQLQAWQVILAGLAGLMIYNQVPSITPALPSNPLASPRKPLFPRRHAETAVAAFTESDDGPDGQEPICDLPVSLRLHNTGGLGKAGPGTGAGLCVFTSIEHAARWQQEQRLYGLQKKMTKEQGGGSPPKVDAMLAKHAPGVEYVQHTGGDEEFLKLALKTRRMPCVTYAGRDSHYAGLIYHMVNQVFMDGDTAAILDNNFEKSYLWMPVRDFLLRWRDAKGGWVVVLLSSPPPPVPHN